MNLVDLVLVIVVAFAAVQGLRLGAIAQVLSFGGFWVGLYLGARLASVTVHWAHSQATRTAVALITMLGVAVSAGSSVGSSGTWPSARLHQGVLGGGGLGCSGVVVAVVASLLAAWLLANTLVNTPSLSLNTSIDQSRIIRSLDRVLPAPPSVFSAVQSFLSAEGFPDVFAQLAPASAGPVSLPGEPAAPTGGGPRRRLHGQDRRRRVRSDPRGFGFRRRPRTGRDQRPRGRRHPPIPWSQAGTALPDHGRVLRPRPSTWPCCG